jgi:hypothetical protein
VVGTSETENSEPSLGNGGGGDRIVHFVGTWKRKSNTFVGISNSERGSARGHLEILQ